MAVMDNEKIKCDVHKVTLLIVDCERYGQEQIKNSIENALEETVVDIQTITVDWDDDHPFNSTDTIRQEMARVFKSV